MVSTPPTQLQSARAAFSIVQEALADQSKLIRWYRARSAGLSTAAIAAALAAVGADVASLAAMGGAAADADTIISAKVELLEEKQMVMRQLVAVDDSFVPPHDYKVRNAARIASLEAWVLNVEVSGLHSRGQLQHRDHILGSEIH